MTINGIPFEVCQDYTVIGKKVMQVASNMYGGWDTLSEAYKTPSRKKEQIWSEWIKWFYSIPDAKRINIFVASRNSNIFTIGFMFELSDKRYYGYITPCHNYVVVRGCD